MSRSVFSVIAALTLAAGATGLSGSAFAAAPMSGAGTQQQVPTSSRMDQSATAPIRPFASSDDGRCPLIYSQPGHEVFGGAGCAGGGGPNAPRDRAGRLE